MRLLGDVLNEQDSVVSERLTLVATIFLPLTLATGFFGMNFQWMLDRLGTMQAFIVFGLAVPSLLTVAHSDLHPPFDSLLMSLRPIPPSIPHPELHPTLVATVCCARER
jgi:hypothetical protein